MQQHNSYLRRLQVGKIVGESTHETSIAEALEKVKAHALFLAVHSNDVFYTVGVFAGHPTAADTFGKIKADLPPFLLDLLGWARTYGKQSAT